MVRITDFTAAAHPKKKPITASHGPVPSLPSSQRPPSRPIVMESAISRPSVPQLPTALYSSFMRPPRAASASGYNRIRLGSNVCARDPRDVCAAARDDALERGAQRGDGARAVADAVLLVVGELGHRAAEAVHDEERIVAEPAAAPRRARHRALAAALDHDLAERALGPG